jgi:hypothetical protein
MEDNELKAFTEALKPGKGRLEEWLEVNNEAECRAAIHALVAAERERCARWYAEQGWLLDEEDVPDAMRKI